MIDSIGRATGKPIVHYRSNGTTPVVGKPAMCYPTDHPSNEVSNTKLVITSRVVNVYDFGFETENTIYVELI